MQNQQELIRDIAGQIRDANRKGSSTEFVETYNKLVDRLFPPGYAKWLEQIRAGDGSAIEGGLVFIEFQPYFFRSQYIRTELIRALKRANVGMSPLQSERFRCILDLQHKKKMKRKAHA